MDDERKLANAAAETTYHPPPEHASDSIGGEGPPDTLAKAADSTRRAAPIPAPSLDDSQVQTVDLPPQEAEPNLPSGSLPTMDWTGSSQGADRSVASAERVSRRIGEYEITGELGRGGMGVVYRARHRQLGRVVALKMIRGGAHADGDELNRFLIEAQAVARLQHPGIVQIFDIGQHDGLPYFSLEYVDGQSLLARIAKEPLEPRQAAQLIEKLARATQYAHDQGILHRDLKPANVLLTSSGEPKLTDFGLAKRIEEADDSATRTGTVMGTPSYMSPEQARGDVKELTPATDQYSLGAVLYHLITGRPPFLAARPVDTILQVIHDEPVSPRQLAPQLPVDLETICLKALNKDPQRRYASCTELADDLHRYLAGEPILARPIGRIERAWRWCQRNPRTAIPSAAAVALFLVAFGISVVAAWRLSALNADLKVQTQAAQTQEGIANQNASKALTAEAEARKQEKIASDNAGVALNTVQRVIVELQSGVGNTPALQPLKKKLVETAAKDLESLKDSIGSSGITGAATTLKYHELMVHLYRDMGQTENAWSHLQLARALAEQRIKHQEGSNATRLNLARVCEDMALLRQDYQRDLQVSLDHAQQAVGLYEDILANPKPALVDSLRMEILFQRLAPAHTSVGLLHVRLGNPQAALASYQKAQQVREQVQQDPAYLRLPTEVREKNQAAIREESARANWSMGDIYYRLGMLKEGRESFSKALATYRELREKHPTDPRAAQSLLGSSSQAGYWLFVTGASDDARPLYEQSLDLAAQLARDYPKIVPLQTTLALMHYRLGVLKESQGDATAKEHFDACLKIRTELAKDAANVSRQRELMLALARAGQHQQAATLAEQLQSAENADAELLVDVARAYAQASTRLPDDAAGATAYRSQSLAALKRAVEAGYQDRVAMASEPDFAPLKDLDEFKGLIASGDR